MGTCARLCEASIVFFEECVPVSDMETYSPGGERGESACIISHG